MINQDQQNQKIARIRRLIPKMSPELLMSALYLIGIKKENIVFCRESKALSIHPGFTKIEWLNDKVYIYANLATIDRRLYDYCTQLTHLAPTQTQRINQLIDDFLRAHFLGVFPCLNPSVNTTIEQLFLNRLSQSPSKILIETHIKRVIDFPSKVNISYGIQPQSTTPNHLLGRITANAQNFDVIPVICVAISINTGSSIAKVQQQQQRLHNKLKQILKSYQLKLEISHPQEITYLRNKKLGQDSLLESKYSIMRTEGISD
ncbi:MULTISPECIES: hypothetical protein [Cysteiniphilum]|uniref:Uncharacterized protein n=1 Tax=Cysteiniphilum litorale TaxID=2056700 RepID=A0A8J2Z5X3_9GAMM|nr:MULTISPECIES: hypothetical protein [Cysteiniphilum]GGG02803.1 hypothetical protein GCM10010995_20270 [Cysteiniphilum litorale]